MQVLGNDCLPAHAVMPACPADCSGAAYRELAPAVACSCDWQNSLVQRHAQTGQHNDQPPAQADERAPRWAAVNTAELALPSVAWWQEPDIADELVEQIQVGAACLMLENALSLLSCPCGPLPFMSGASRPPDIM